MIKLPNRFIIVGLILFDAVGIAIGLFFLLEKKESILEETAFADISSVVKKNSSSEIIEETTSSEINDSENVEIAANAHLDVPQVNQMDSPSLYNGCEVTSLAMLLNYYGNNVTKNELAETLSFLPYKDNSGYYGNPNEGFVGDIYGNDAGYFVYHEPIFALAENYNTKELVASDLTGDNFSSIQRALTAGNPVWVITTTSFSATTDMMTWRTNSGTVEVSMSEHSVVLIGYDENHVYLNDPYGNENYATDITNFIASWEQMGSQAITMSSI